MQYTVEGVDKTAGIREKAKSICELVSEPSRLEEEREFARKNRDKFRGYSNNDGPSAGTGSSYKGFGSEDLKKYGGPDSYTPGSSYDPYKKESIFGEKAKDETGSKKKRRKKKRKASSSEEESDSEESEDSEEVQKVQKYKKKKAKGLA